MKLNTIYPILIYMMYLYILHFIIQILFIVYKMKSSSSSNKEKTLIATILNGTNPKDQTNKSCPSPDDNNKHIVLLVIAHPDDEAMFFIPTLQNIKEHKNTILSVLCLSSGNADGLGKVREKELIESCKHLGIDSKYVNIIDDPNLQDGFNEIWHEELISSKIIEMDQTILSNQLNLIITFDHYGISGHPNHISTYHGVKYYLQQQLNQKNKVVNGYKLISHNIIRKFTGMFDIPVTLVQTFIDNNHLNYYLTTNPIDTWIAMTLHESQFVLIPYWWRRFFVILSRYTYINTLEEI